MIKVYEYYSKTSYESIRFASQYFGVSSKLITDNMDKDEIKIRGAKRRFTSRELPQPHPWKDFMNEKGLKHMIGAFYLNKDKEVYLWSKKKGEWFKWKVTKFDNGNMAFKTKIKDKNNRPVNKWVNVNQYYKSLFA